VSREILGTVWLLLPLLGGALLHGLCMRYGWLGWLARPIDDAELGRRRLGPPARVVPLRAQLPNLPLEGVERCVERHGSLRPLALRHELPAACLAHDADLLRAVTVVRRGARGDPHVDQILVAGSERLEPLLDPAAQFVAEDLGVDPVDLHTLLLERVKGAIRAPAEAAQARNLGARQVPKEQTGLQHEFRLGVCPALVQPPYRRSAPTRGAAPDAGVAWRGGSGLRDIVLRRSATAPRVARAVLG